MKHPSAPSGTVLLIALLALLVALPGCVVSKNPVTGNKRAYGYTWAQEVQIGQEQDQLIVQQFGVYEDAALQNYVEQVGERVLAESHLRRPGTDEEFRNTPFTFRILDSEVINAFALPGGFVYVTRGLMNHLENEAQLAVVLGHEIGHVAARHASKRAASQTFGQLGLIGGAVLAEGVLGGGAGQSVLDLGGTAAQLLFLSYSREDERESDDLGVEYAALSGYEASEGAGFFTTLDRLGQQSEGSIPGFLSTHPDPGERELTIQRHAEEWRGQTSMTIVDRDEYLNRIDGTVLGQNPRSGFAENGVFYHPDLRFRFPVPSNFQVINQPTQVGMISPNEDAIQIFTFAAEASSARQAASTFANQEGITVTESGATTSNGLPAYYLIASAQTQQGQTVRLLDYYVEYDNTVYRFLGYSTANAFNAYQNEFLRAARGFAPLTDPQILNIQPTRLNVVPASRTAPFRSFLPSTLPRDLTAEEMAILNQVQLDETIQRGTRIKLFN